jgi:CheY-like chemotaxis protein
MASFSVYLKAGRRQGSRRRRPAPAPPAVRPAPKPRPAAGRPPLAGLGILVVEDHRDSREILEQLLTRDGARVSLAEHGQHALDILAREQPDAILLDLLMPVMDGFALIRHLQQDPRWAGIPVVAVTALGGDLDFRRTFEHGFDAHLTKPIHYDELLGLILRLTSSRRRPGAPPCPSRRPRPDHGASR